MNEVYEVDFDGNIKAKIRVTGNGIEVIEAMDGWGNAVPLNLVNIVKTK